MSCRIVVLACALAPSLSLAAGPWLPEPQRSDLTFAYLTQSTDEFFAGETELRLPRDLELDTFAVGYTYGVSDRLTVDIAGGWARSEFTVAPPLTDAAELDGVIDSRIGLRYRLLDEFASGGLTLTLSGAVLIEGDYETGAINAVGDGASGLEASILAGRIFATGLSLSGEAGYRYQNHNVPNEWFASADVGYTFTPYISARVGYAFVDALDGIDIGGPGFTPARFPEVEEDYQVFSAGLSVSFTDRFGISLEYGNKLDGRNTVKTDVWALNASFGW